MNWVFMITPMFQIFPWWILQTYSCQRSVDILTQRYCVLPAVTLKKEKYIFWYESRDHKFHPDLMVCSSRTATIWANTRRCFKLSSSEFFMRPCTERSWCHSFENCVWNQTVQQSPQYLQCLHNVIFVLAYALYLFHNHLFNIACTMMHASALPLGPSDFTLIGQFEIRPCATRVFDQQVFFRRYSDQNSSCWDLVWQFLQLTWAQAIQIRRICLSICSKYESLQA